MADMIAATVILVFTVLFIALYVRSTIKVKHPFLLDASLQQNLSIAQIADASIDYWAKQIMTYENSEQKAYCFNKANEAHKEALALEAAANQPAVEPQTLDDEDIDIPLPANVIQFPS